MQGGAALPLVLMTLGAVAMPAAARKIAIPVAVAEILYGVLIGPSGTGLVADADNAFIQFLAELGFAFFLFLAGLEIDFRGFERKGLIQLLLPAVVSLTAFGLSIGTSLALGWGVWVGLATGATAVPLLLAVVREARLNGTDLGNTMISFAAMGELLTIVLLSIVEIHTHAHGLSDALVAGGKLVGLCVAVVVVVILLRTLLWWYPAPFTRMVAHDDPSEFGVRVGFSMMFAFIGLSMMAGVEPFLGAFVAGAMLSFVVREADVLEHKLASMAYGFFVPVFFIHVGIKLAVTPQIIYDNAGQIAAIIGIMFAVKVIPGMLLRLRGLSMIETTATCALLAAPLTLVIAIMDLGARAGAVTSSTQVVVITAGIMASLIFPSAARKLLNSPGAGTKPPISAAH